MSVNGRLRQGAGGCPPDSSIARQLSCLKQHQSADSTRPDFQTKRTVFIWPFKMEYKSIQSWFHRMRNRPMNFVLILFHLRCPVLSPPLYSSSLLFDPPCLQQGEARVEVKEISAILNSRTKQTVMPRKKWNEARLGGDSVAVTVVRRKDAALGSDKPFFVCVFPRFLPGNTWNIPGWNLSWKCTETTWKIPWGIRSEDRERIRITDAEIWIWNEVW